MMISGLDFAVTYLDDILWKSKNLEKHKKKKNTMQYCVGTTCDIGRNKK